MNRLKLIGLVIVAFLAIETSGVFANEDEDFYVAQKAFSEGFYDAAEGLFRKFISMYPQSTKGDEAKLIIAKSLFYKERFSDAEKILQELIASETAGSAKSKALHWLGEINFQAKKYETAVEFFKKAREDKSDPSTFWWSTYSLGFSYLELDDKDEAYEVFTDIIKNSPEGEVRQKAFYALCKSYYKDKKYDSLQELAVSWLEEFPASALRDYIYFYLGESQYFFREFLKASEYYKQALAVSKDESLKDSIFQGLGWSCLEKENFSEAKDWFFKISSQEIKLYSLGSLYFKLHDYKEAHDYFDKFIESYPQSSFIYKAYLGEAESLYNLGRINDAFSYYNKITEAKDSLVDKKILEEAYYSLGWCYLKMNDYRKAIDQFKKLTFSKEAIIKISAQINIGDVYQESGNLNEALEVYEQVLREFSDNLYSDYIQLQIGLCLLKKDDLEAALLAFDSLVKNFPSSKLEPEALYYAALCHASLGNFQEAARILEDSIARFGQSKTLKKMYLLITQVYIENGDSDNVLRVFSEAAKKFSGDSEFLERMQVQKGLFYIDQGQEDLAKKEFEKFLKTFPDSELKERIFLYLANIYHKEQDYSRAKTYYNQILKKGSASKYSYQARLDLAQIIWEEGNHEDAQAILKDNLSLSSSKEVIVQTKLMLIEFMLSQGSFTKALEFCDNLIEAYPDSKGFFYFKKAQIYEDNEDYQQAYQNYLKAQEAQFDSPQLRFSKGYALEKMGNSGEAIKNFLEGIYIFPDDKKNIIKSYLRIAKLYEKLGQPREASKAYRKIIDMDVEEAKYAREKLEELEESKKD
ncbi:MAG: tetratricopeptide repeat protein [Candidatus Omnitrophica bacterium]|nr:tetratricopeptide repeat protein [Candidatus Omnitrophota bacterium]